VRSQSLPTEATVGLIDIVSRYTQTFLLLQRYDEGLLTHPKGMEGGLLASIEEVRSSIVQLKAALSSQGEAGALFGIERGDALESIIANLGQSVFGKPAYNTVQSKAAHLLYFVIKDHPMMDGNKRIAAFLFLDFLHSNHALIKNGEPIIDDMGLAALALLVAESNPSQKDVMIRLIENILANQSEV
jgi:prophage maintenance system killer protein